MIGLSHSELQTLRDVFSRFSDISEVILFGSRARGTHRPSSDVDLALKGGNLSIDTLSKLRYILEEETNLPYFFDIVVYDRVENEALKREIDEDGEII
ncbi:MAG: nucleotidyltransferase domain-containing protein [Pseudomonadota bacterium]